jgi:hypothetical protein
MASFSADLSSLVPSSIISVKNPETLLKYTTDQNGSRVIESIFESATIPVSKKEELCKVFTKQRVFPELAKSKFGSHVIDKIWNCETLAMDVKRDVAFQLHSTPSIKNDFYGKFVWRNCGLEEFEKREGEWIGKMKKKEKKKRMFDDIIYDQGNKKSKRED